MLFFLNTGVAIFFCVLFILAAPIAIYFLYRGIRKDRVKFRESKLVGTELSKENMDEIVRRRFAGATSRTHFSLFWVVIADAVAVKKTFGELQYKNAVRVLMARIEKIFPQGTKLCQYSYDGILILTDETLGAQELESYAKFIIAECEKTVALAANLQLDFDVNIGIASYDEFNRSYEQIWQNLELALVVAKRSGADQFVIHTSELNNRESDEYKYYQEIKEAIENNEFTLYYQPFVETDTLNIAGFETLLRWNHKTMGVLSPDKFLNILEQSGDINWVGLWAFEELLQRQLAWRQRSPEKKFLLSMNLSPKQLMNERLADDIRRILRKYRVEPSSVVLEIVEFAYFEKVPAVKSNIEKLSQNGFLIAIDNYGPEMNTLALLEEVKIDLIKLDRGFVSKAREDFLSNGLLTTLVQYAERKGTKILAEGIEDSEMLDYVKSMGIGLAQGYLFGKPQSPEEWEKSKNI